MITDVSSAHVRWGVPAALYTATFALLTAADFISTNLFLSATGGREMNAHMLDSATGMLSARFLGVHALLLVAYVGALVFGLSGLRPAQAHSLGVRDVLLSFDSGSGRGPFRWVFLAAAVLVMKALVPISNVAEFAAGLGGPGLIRMILGSPGDAVVLPVLIGLTVAVGFAAAGPIVRWASARYGRVG